MNRPQKFTRPYGDSVEGGRRFSKRCSYGLPIYDRPRKSEYESTPDSPFSLPPMPTTTTNESQNARSDTLEVEDGAKPTVLALWSSLKMADELSEFCGSGFETIQRFDFEVLPASDVGQLTGEGSDPRRYSAILLAYAEDDGPVAGVDEFVREWARFRAQSGEKPMIICREGLLPPGQFSRQGKFWTELIDSLSEEFSADVIRDSRLLFSAMQAGNTERCN